jgi:hypothetical protein
MKLIQSVNNPSRLHKDFVCRCLKSEAQFLFSLLKTVEQSGRLENEYIRKSLRISVMNLKGLVRLL